MNFQENLFGSIPWSHGCNWDNLKCESNPSVFTVYRYTLDHSNAKACVLVCLPSKTIHRFC